MGPSEVLRSPGFDESETLPIEGPRGLVQVEVSVPRSVLICEALALAWQCLMLAGQEQHNLTVIT